jgi:GAF domain-containing protein
MSTELPLVRKLELLLEVTSKTSRSQDLQELLDLVMDTLFVLVSYDAAGIYLLQTPEAITKELVEHPHIFHTKALRGYDSNAPTDISLKSSEGLDRTRRRDWSTDHFSGRQTRFAIRHGTRGDPLRDARTDRFQ